MPLIICMYGLSLSKATSSLLVRILSVYMTRCSSALVTGKLRNYLESLSSAESVPDFVSSHPFESFKPVITLTDLLKMQQDNHFSEGNGNGPLSSTQDATDEDDEDDEIVLAPMGRLAI